MPALKKIRADVAPLNPPARDPSAEPHLAGPADGPVDSPALKLKSDLEGAFTPPQAKRWPLSVSVPLWFCVAGVMWWGIIQGAFAILHR
jgi:hypothetical protein